MRNGQVVCLITILTLGLTTLAGAHDPEGELFFAVQFPDNAVPTIDGDLSDWDIVPKNPYVISSEKIFDTVQFQNAARGELDLSDFNPTHIVGWNERYNKLYFATTVFDNIHNIDREHPAQHWLDDNWEVEVNPTHLAAEEQNLPDESVNRVAYKWVVPPLEGVYQSIEPIGDLAWLSDGTDYISFGWSFEGEMFGESTYHYELSLTPIASLLRENATPANTVFHDLEEDNIIHLSIFNGDIESGDDYQGFWGTITGSGNIALNDFVLAPMDPQLSDAVPETPGTLGLTIENLKLNSAGELVFDVWANKMLQYSRDIKYWEVFLSIDPPVSIDLSSTSFDSDGVTASDRYTTREDFVKGWDENGVDVHPYISWQDDWFASPGSLLFSPIVYNRYRLGTTRLTLSPNTELSEITVRVVGVHIGASHNAGEKEFLATDVIVIEPEIGGIVSVTHPSPTEWSDTNQPQFSWEEHPDADLYLYALQSDTGGLLNQRTIDILLNSKGEVVIDSEVHFNEIGDGKWVFHVGKQQGNDLTYIGSYRFRIDTSVLPPDRAVIGDRELLIRAITGSGEQSVIVGSPGIEIGLSLDWATEQAGYRYLYFSVDEVATSAPPKLLPNRVSVTPPEMDGSLRSIQTVSLTGLSDGLHFLHVFTVDSLNNESAVVHVPITVDTTPPTEIQNVRAFSLTDGDVILDWFPADDLESGIRYYRIYRSTKLGKTGTQINRDGETTVPEYRDLSLDNGGSIFPTVEYFFSITAVNGAGFEGPAVSQYSSRSLPPARKNSIQLSHEPLLTPFIDVVLTVSGEFAVSGAEIVDISFQSEGRELVVELTSAWTSDIVTESLVPWSLDVEVGRLLEGSYNVSIVVNGMEQHRAEIDIVGRPRIVPESVALTIQPDAITIVDQIEFVVSGDLEVPDAAISNSSVSLNDLVIQIEIETDWVTDSAIEGTTEWHVVESLESINAGEYSVFVLVNDNIELSTSLTVLGGPLLEGPIAIDFNPAEGDQEQRQGGSATAGKVFSMQIIVGDAPVISGWSATIEFDPEQVAYVSDSFQVSSFIPGLLALVNEKESSVGIGGTVLGTDSKNSGDGELAELSFEVLDGFTGSTDLKITKISFRRTDGVEDKRDVHHVVTITSEAVVGALAGDFDGSGGVDFSDFFMFADAFGGTDPQFDLSGDGEVDFDDFFVFADNFGKEAQAKLIALAEQYIGLPPTPRLEQNYPNPFNASTTLRYRLTHSGPCMLEIFDLTGQQIRTLEQGVQPAGLHKVTWDGTNDLGNRASTGLYLARLRSGDFVDVKKMAFVK
jgi:hypothetical protein